MALGDDIRKEVGEILDWKIEVKEEKNKVPEKSDLTLGETAVTLETCVLYVDMRGSSTLADSHRQTTAAKIYNAYLNAMVRIARDNSGRIRSFNGDSVLVFFNPNVSNICDKAVRTAFQMRGVARDIIRPALQAKKYEDDFHIGVGITKGRVLTTKAGIRGDANNNDLIWPCTPVNMAAKLGDAADASWPIIIAADVYHGLTNDWKLGKNSSGQQVDMWTKDPYFTFADSQVTVYKTTWYCPFK